MAASPSTQDSSSANNYQGKWAVLSVVIVGILLATFGWWWNLQRGIRCLEYWGPSAAQHIRLGTEVFAYQLQAESEDVSDSPAASATASSAESTPSAAPAEQFSLLRIETDEGVFLVRGEQDISTIRGLIHARNSLLDDASFAWNDTPPSNPKWTHVLRFRNEGEAQSETLVLLDLPNACLKEASSNRILKMVDRSESAWRIAFGDRYFTDPQWLPEIDTP